MNKKMICLGVMLAACVVSGESIIELGSQVDFTDQFSIIDSSGQGSIGWSSDDGAAVLSGRINVSVPENSGKMIYHNQPFSLREGELTFSFLFLAEEFSSSNNTRIALGVSYDKVNLRANARAQLRLINNAMGFATLEVRSAMTGAVSSSDVALIDGHWYRLEASFRLSETAGAIDVAGKLVDCGETGSMSHDLVAEAMGIRSDTGFFSGGVPSDVYVGILAQNDNGGAQAIDDITLPVYDFSAEWQMEACFTNYPGAGAITYSTADGVGSFPGSLALSGIGGTSAEALYGLSEMDPDDGSIGASFFFRGAAYVNNGNYSRIALGLSPDKQNLQSGSEVQVRLIKASSSNKASFEVRDGSGADTSNVSLLEDHWYKFSALFSPTGSSSFQVDAVLEDCGTSGQANPSVVATASATRVAPADFKTGNDRLPLSVGILAQNDGGGADALDQIQIPKSTPVAPSQCSTNLFSWWTAVGTHYWLNTDAYLGTSRSFPSPSELSHYPDVTDESHPGITGVTGHFSGETRYYDFEGVLTNRGTKALNYGAYLQQAAAAHVDLIWNLGQIKFNNTDHVAFIKANDAKYYKDLVYQAVVYVNSGEFSNLPITVYWELGNEINHADRFSLHDNGNKTNNLTNAFDYREYYLAPAVEAIRAASMDLYGDPDRVKTLLGNVCYLRNTNTQAFLSRILNGSIVLTQYAPTLVGKMGYELVNGIGLHYSEGTASVIDTYYNAWVGTGTIRNMWNTEELGKNGLGDYDIVLHGFRWMDYWAQKPWTPQTARVGFWGDDRTTDTNREDRLISQTTGAGMEYFLGQLLQDYPLVRVDPANIAITATGDPEKYGFWTKLPNGGYRAVVLIAADEDWTLSSVSLPLPGTVKYAEAYKQSVEHTKVFRSSSWTGTVSSITLTPDITTFRREDELIVIVETMP